MTTPIESVTPAQATAALNEMTAAVRGAPASGTAAEAAAQLQALMSNPEWGKRYMEGGSAERAKFNELNARIASGDPVADLIAGKVEPPSIETTTGDELPSRTMLQAVSDLQARGLTDQAIAEILNGQKFTAEQVRTAERWRERVSRDPIWRAAYLKGDADHAREMLVANAIIAGGTGAA